MFCGLCIFFEVGFICSVSVQANGCCSCNQKKTESSFCHYCFTHEKTIKPTFSRNKTILFFGVRPCNKKTQKWCPAGDKNSSRTIVSMILSETLFLENTVTETLKLHKPCLSSVIVTQSDIEVDRKLQCCLQITAQVISYFDINSTKRTFLTVNSLFCYHWFWKAEHKRV